jgi:hypothetical protein
MVLLAVGCAVLLPPLGVRDAGSYLFLFLGLAFAVAYAAGRHQFVYLLPAATLIGFGTGLLIPQAMPALQDRASAIFLGSLAAAFAAVYVLAPSRRTPIVVAAVVGVVALAELVAKIELVPAGLQPYFVPVILIVAGGYLLLEPRAH